MLWMVIAALIGAAVPGVTLVRYYLELEPRPPSLPATLCPQDRGTGPVRHPSEYTDRAAPYAGPGPHPADFFQLGDGREVHPVLTEPDNERLPAEWRPTGATASTNASTNVQLVVCEYLTRTGSAIKSCTYHQPPYDGLSTAVPRVEGRAVTMSLIEASYTYQVYEARTGNLIAKFDLDGSSSCPPFGFPYQARLRPGETQLHWPQEIQEQVSNSHLYDQLRPIIAGTVRTHTPR
ncbi:hypothetical protein ACTMTJ_34795 [Phytohabitans sp. LJ34]|uniref:hypothetical protein n=1 Tax=Phytohabitans sp. LJ34 TaxID=3452217 RepID=UPI003F89CAB7